MFLGFNICKCTVREKGDLMTCMILREPEFGGRVEVSHSYNEGQTSKGLATLVQPVSRRYVDLSRPVTSCRPRIMIER